MRNFLHITSPLDQFEIRNLINSKVFWIGFSLLALILLELFFQFFFGYGLIVGVVYAEEPFTSQQAHITDLHIRMLVEQISWDHGIQPRITLGQILYTNSRLDTPFYLNENVVLGVKHSMGHNGNLYDIVFCQKNPNIMDPRLPLNQQYIYGDYSRILDRWAHVGGKPKL